MPTLVYESPMALQKVIQVLLRVGYPIQSALNPKPDPLPCQNSNDNHITNLKHLELDTYLRKNQ